MNMVQETGLLWCTNAVDQHMSQHTTAYPAPPMMDMQQTSFFIEAIEVMNGIQIAGARSADMLAQQTQLQYDQGRRQRVARAGSVFSQVEMEIVHQ